MTITLEAKMRAETGKKAKALRTAGMLPAVVYGPKQAPLTLSVSHGAFEKIFKEAGESSVVTLTGLDKDIDVLIHDMSFDAKKGGVTHVDFYAIEKGKKIKVDVPLHYIGEAPALKLGGTLTKVLHEVEVEAEATHIPKEIIVDISSLVDFDSQIHVRDLVVSAGAVITEKEDDVVALVQTVKDEVDAPTLDMSAIEVEKKGKSEAGEA